MVDIVTAPTKRVTDPLVLKRLGEQGIDHRFVSFERDYAPKSRGAGFGPYCKSYQNLLNPSQWIMAISGLPMVDAYGFFHELAWREKDGVLENGNNIFHAIVDKGTVRLITLSDQPNGLKKDDEGQYHPQLFIGGSEVQPSAPIPIILATDPANSYYHDNVISWNYDTLCRRRIRLREGRYRERWLVDIHPNGRVRIKHNTSGKLRLKLGTAVDARGKYLKVTVIDDEEIIEASEFDGAAFPVEIGASSTFYPDGGGFGVDGNVGRNPQEAWADKHDGAGTDHRDAEAVETFAYLSSINNLYAYLFRGIFVYDATSLPILCIITAGVHSLRGNAKVDTLYTPTIGTYTSDPAGNNALANADYLHTKFGTTDLSNIITFAAFDIAGYNDFFLLDVDADGFGYISKTIETNLGTRLQNSDAINVGPAPTVGANPSNFSGYFSEQGAGYKPKLVVTYSTAEAPTVTTFRPHKRMEFHPNLKLG